MTRSENNRTVGIYLILILSTVIAYWGVPGNDFVSYDDPGYVTENPNVTEGITPQSFKWAFTAGHMSNWHPLTWLSHMLDCQFFGLNSTAHHLHNLLLHIASTLLLFEVLRRMTGAMWKSAFVAAAFALHPMHVESVAWVAERKDVLSGLFWMLTMAAYLNYIRHSKISCYLLLVATYALGLMAKPMLVTLPFVLLLLDYWPLGRMLAKQPLSTSAESNARSQPLFQRSGFAALLLEKTPLFLLAAASSTVTFLVQQQTGAMGLIQHGHTPFGLRISNAVVTCVTYVVKMVLPTDLTVLYPFPENGVETWRTIIALASLVVVTIIVIRFRKTSPWLPVGWFWYLGTLLPVIGLVQVGIQSMADRYTYIPYIGLFLILVFQIDRITEKLKRRSLILTLSACLCLTAMIACTRFQVGHWKDNFTLYSHTLKVTKDNYLINYNLGLEFAKKSRFEKAEEHFRNAIAIKPNYDQAHNDLGNTLMMQGKNDEALVYYGKAIAHNPDHPLAHYNMALIFKKKGRVKEAIRSFRESLRTNPDVISVHYTLGLLLIEDTQTAQAVEQLRKYLEEVPDNESARQKLEQLMNSLEQK